MTRSVSSRITLVGSTVQVPENLSSEISSSACPFSSNQVRSTSKLIVTVPMASVARLLVSICKYWKTSAVGGGRKWVGAPESLPTWISTVPLVPIVSMDRALSASERVSRVSIAVPSGCTSADPDWNTDTLRPSGGCGSSGGLRGERKQPVKTSAAATAAIRHTPIILGTEESKGILVKVIGKQSEKGERAASPITALVSVILDDTAFR